MAFMNGGASMVKRLIGADFEHITVISQFLRYGLVGVGVTVLGVLAYWIIATPLGVQPLLANLFAYLIAVVVGYFLHSHYSFQGHGTRDNPGRTVGRFLIVSFVSLALNSFWIWIATGLLGGPTWWPVPAMVFVTPVVVFTLNRQWVFG